MAEPADINVDELRRRARRRLVGAVVLALGVAVVVPMLLETEQKPLGDDVAVKIPPVDSGKFVNRLNDGAPNADANARNDAASDSGGAPAASVAESATPARTQKYDTQLPPTAATPTQPAADGAASQTPDATASKATEPARAASAGAGGAEDAKAASAEGTKAAGAESTKAASVESTKTPSTAHAPGSAAKASFPASHREGFAVQLAAFADDRGANSLAGRLKRAGYAAYTEPLKTSKGTLWRVRVGPYPSREAAAAARDKLKTEGQSGIVAAIK